MAAEELLALLLCALLPHPGLSIDNGLGLSPPMGWSANNAWHWIYGQDVMEASYEVLASRARSVDGKPTSMADVGYVSMPSPPPPRLRLRVSDCGWRAAGR